MTSIDLKLFISRYIKVIHVLVVIGLFCSMECVFAQQEKGSQQSDPLRSVARFKDRRQTNIPEYSLVKIIQLLENTPYPNIEEDTTDQKIFYAIPQWGGFNKIVPEKAFAEFSILEKFTYCMLNYEWSLQNCGGFGRGRNREKFIFGNLYIVFRDFSWSDRQLSFFHDNQDSVKHLLSQVINKDGFLGFNTKELIVELNDWEKIPVILNQLKLHENDSELWTILLLLMKRAKFLPFYSSKIYEELYGNESNHRSTIENSISNRENIKHWAEEFYMLKKK